MMTRILFRRFFARYLSFDMEGVDRDGQPHQAETNTQQLAAASTRAHPASKGGGL